MSPNLSSDHFSENRLMYEQVVYNTLSLTGLARPLTSSIRYNGEYESVMLVSEADIQVPLEVCLDTTCAQCTEKKVRVVWEVVCLLSEAVLAKTLNFYTYCVLL